MSTALGEPEVDVVDLLQEPRRLVAPKLLDASRERTDVLRASATQTDTGIWHQRPILASHSITCRELPDVGIPLPVAGSYHNHTDESVVVRASEHQD
ncbi:hypothetical protein [uncultured Amnibacterium sp.]|uniref:hypothetical protein n=1 Tax=uncultured Amnibacterium sp. TaxID=1631851 RepID=UPI0035CB39EC